MSTKILAVPSDYDISDNGDGTITAKNAKLGTSFTGTRAAFNSAIASIWTTTTEDLERHLAEHLQISIQDEVPQLITAGGAKATGKIVFTGNIVSGDTVSIGTGVVTAKPPAASAVGKIVFTDNFVPNDIVSIGGVAFTALSTPSVGKIVFTDNILAGDTVTINSVVFTAMASGATGELQFDVGLTLSLSLDALILKLNNCTDVLVSYATYTKTDGSTAVTTTAKVSGAANDGIVLSSTHVSVVVTAPVGGADLTATQFDITQTLSATLDNLVTKLNASVNPIVSTATYTKTDTNTALTVTFDGTLASDNSIVLASTHSTVVVTQPTGGVNVTTASEFDVGGSLSVSLDNLVITLNASTNAIIQTATYSKTDTNTALTLVFDTNRTLDNDIVIASNHSTVVVTQPHGGHDDAVVAMDKEHTQINLAGATGEVSIPDGGEGDHKTIAMIGTGTANLISLTDKLPGTTNNYAMTEGNVLIMQYVGGKWRLLLNEGATAS